MVRQKYPRDNDSTTLGDWVVDTNKLPNGIRALIDSASTHGIKFGIRIEPEMTNTVSELYEKHPEYIIKAANRPATQGRGGTQLVLDLANPKVQDIVFTVVDTLMRKYPAIDYIKWDANAPIMDHGSQYLTADNQSHLYIDYHKGFETVLNRIRKAHPDVTIRACASGGGRANWGILPGLTNYGPATTMTLCSASTCSGAPATSSLPLLWDRTSRLHPTTGLSAEFL